MNTHALIILAFASALAFGGPAGAQTSERLGESQLRQIEGEINAARTRGTALEGEIETLIKESNALSERLVLMAARVQAREARITAGEEKLEGLDLEERALKDKLKRQHKMLGHLLAGLQRLEQDPPPALVVKPDDAVSALRGAMLLGAIVPELKDEASVISKSLNRLVSLRAAIVRERANVERNIAALSRERGEIESLLTQKTQVEARAREELKITRQRADVLAKKAKTVRQLMTELVKKRKEAEIAAKKAEQERLEKLAEKQRIAEQRRKEEEKHRISALMRPKFKFSKAKGQLAYPVQGERVANFGSTKRDGSKSKGLSIATRSDAQVISPADGAIEFAGDFRTYGKLLIINAGEGYYLLLAGLEEISVSAGQAIRAGEPVGTMGSNAALGVTGSKSGDSRPVLYVEFRRNDKSIDPRPWWAGRANDKVRG